MSRKRAQEVWVVAFRPTILAATLLSVVGCAPETVSDPEGAGLAAALVEGPTEEEAEGWRSLFDGQTLDGWRGYGLEGLPSGWSIVDGEIHFAVPEEGERADLMTVEQFRSFELSFEWKVSEGGNSGVMFHVTEDHNRAYETGAEYQILHNAGHRDGERPITSAGSNYALHEPARDVTRPLGEFNEARLLVDGSHVEHWLNGEKLLEYTLWDEEWKERVAASKFAAMPDYGLRQTGHIVIQDHGDEIWLRNIKIRALP